MREIRELEEKLISDISLWTGPTQCAHIFAESANSSVYSLSPYSSDTARRTLNASDSIYSEAGGRRAEVGLKGTAGSGFDGKIVLGVDPKASPAEV